MSVLVFDPQEAVQFGLNEAIMLQQIRYWLSKPHHDQKEREWIYNSHEQWREQFPFWSITTIRRVIKSLEDQGVIDSEMREVHRGLVCKFYRVSVSLSEGYVHSGQGGVSNLDTPGVQTEHIYIDQETSQNTTTEHIPAIPACAESPLAQLEQQLGPEAAEAWTDLKQSMQQHRAAKMRDGTPLKLLQEFLASAKQYSLSQQQIAHGIRACWRCEPPAENERYFRKAALGYRDEPLTPRGSSSFPGTHSPQPTQYNVPAETRQPILIPDDDPIDPETVAISVRAAEIQQERNCGAARAIQLATAEAGTRARLVKIIK